MGDGQGGRGHVREVKETWASMGGGRPTSSTSARSYRALTLTLTLTQTLTPTLTPTPTPTPSLTLTP